MEGGQRERLTAVQERIPYRSGCFCGIAGHRRAVLWSTATPPARADADTSPRKCLTTQAVGAVDRRRLTIGLSRPRTARSPAHTGAGEVTYSRQLRALVVVRRTGRRCDSTSSLQVSCAGHAVNAHALISRRTWRCAPTEALRKRARRRGWSAHPRARKSGFFACFEAKKQAINAREEHASADRAI
jgi:hypothetical protein